MPRLPLPPGGHRACRGDARARCSRAASGSGSAPARRSTSTSSAASGRRSAIRSAMMFEAIEIINKLFTGKVVKHQGEHFTLESAKLYTRPERAGADLRRHGRADQRQEDRQVRRRHDHGRRGGREDQDALGQVRRGLPASPARTAALPKLLQIHVSWAPTDEEAVENAVTEWPNGGMPFPKQDIKQPRGLRGDGEAGPAGELQEPRAHHARPRRARRPTSSTTWTWASTRSTSTTSGATRPSSSRSSAGGPAEPPPRSAGCGRDRRRLTRHPRTARGGPGWTSRSASRASEPGRPTTCCLGGDGRRWAVLSLAPAIGCRARPRGADDPCLAAGVDPPDPADGEPGGRARPRDDPARAPGGHDPRRCPAAG